MLNPGMEIEVMSRHRELVHAAARNRAQVGPGMLASGISSSGVRRPPHMVGKALGQAVAGFLAAVARVARGTADRLEHSANSLQRYRETATPC